VNFKPTRGLACLDNVFINARATRSQVNQHISTHIYLPQLFSFIVGTFGRQLEIIDFILYLRCSLHNFYQTNIFRLWSMYLNIFHAFSVPAAATLKKWLFPISSAFMGIFQPNQHISTNMYFNDFMHFGSTGHHL